MRFISTTTIRLATLALAVGLPFAAAAEDRLDGQAPDVSYQFDDHAVDGGRYTPDGDSVTIRLRGSRSTLVRPRVHFVPELVRSVERL